MSLILFFIISCVIKVHICLPSDVGDGTVQLFRLKRSMGKPEMSMNLRTYKGNGKHLPLQRGDTNEDNPTAIYYQPASLHYDGSNKYYSKSINMPTVIKNDGFKNEIKPRRSINNQNENTLYLDVGLVEDGIGRSDADVQATIHDFKKLEAMIHQCVILHYLLDENKEKIKNMSNTDVELIKTYENMSLNDIVKLIKKECQAVEFELHHSIHEINMSRPVRSHNKQDIIKKDNDESFTERSATEQNGIDDSTTTVHDELTTVSQEKINEFVNQTDPSERLKDEDATTTTETMEKANESDPKITTTINFQGTMENVITTLKPTELLIRKTSMDSTKENPIQTTTAIIEFESSTATMTPGLKNSGDGDATTIKTTVNNASEESNELTTSSSEETTKTIMEDVKENQSEHLEKSAESNETDEESDNLTVVPKIENSPARKNYSLHFSNGDMNITTPHSFEKNHSDNGKKEIETGKIEDKIITNTTTTISETTDVQPKNCNHTSDLDVNSCIEALSIDDKNNEPFNISKQAVDGDKENSIQKQLIQYLSEAPHEKQRRIMSNDIEANTQENKSLSNLNVIPLVSGKMVLLTKNNNQIPLKFIQDITGNVTFGIEAKDICKELLKTSDSLILRALCNKKCNIE